MEITVKRTGGFAGVREMLGPVSTRSMDGDLAEQIHSKVQQIGFFELPAQLPERLIHDGFHYETTVTDGERAHSVRYGDGTSDRRGVDELTRLILKSGATFGAMEGLSEAAQPEFFEWEAWYNRMPWSEDEDLHVAGTCGLPSSNSEAKLALVENDERLVVLELTVESPPVGDTQYLEVPVWWQGDVGPNVKLVRIRGEADVEIEVGERV